MLNINNLSPEQQTALSIFLASLGQPPPIPKKPKKQNKQKLPQHLELLIQKIIKREFFT